MLQYIITEVMKTYAKKFVVKHYESIRDWCEKK